MPSATPRLGNVAGRPTGSHAGRPRPWPHTGFPGRSTGQPHGGGWCRPVPAQGPRQAPPSRTRVPTAQPRRPRQVGGRGEQGSGLPLHPAHSPRAAARAAAAPAAARPPPAAPLPGPLRSLARSAPARNRPLASLRSPRDSTARSHHPHPYPSRRPPRPRGRPPRPRAPGPAHGPPRRGRQAPPTDRGRRSPELAVQPTGPLSGPHSPLRAGRGPARLPAKPGLESGMGRGPGLPSLHARCSRTLPPTLRPLKPLHTPSHSADVTLPTGNFQGPSRIPCGHI